jgi:hypothetical protein
LSLYVERYINDSEKERLIIPTVDASFISASGLGSKFVSIRALLLVFFPYDCAHSHDTRIREAAIEERRRALTTDQR